MPPPIYPLKLRPFTSAIAERVAKNLSGFKKSATGEEILTELERRNVIPKGYKEFYLPGRVEGPSTVLRPDVGYVADELQWLRPERRQEFLDTIRNIRMERGGIQPDPSEVQLADLINPTRDQLVPWLKRAFINPEIEVRSNIIQRIMSEMPGAQHPGRFKDWIGDYNSLSRFFPQFETSQRALSSAPEYVELIGRPSSFALPPSPGLGLPIQGGGYYRQHFAGDPYFHIRGEVVPSITGPQGKTLLGIEQQFDWASSKLKQTKELATRHGDIEYLSRLKPKKITNRHGDERWVLVHPEEGSINENKLGEYLRSELNLGEYSPIHGDPTNQLYIDNPLLAKAEFYSKERAKQKASTLLDYAKERLEMAQESPTIPSMPPELEGKAPEVSTRSLLAYGAARPDIREVFFPSEELIRATRGGSYNPESKLYSERIPNFLNRLLGREYGSSLIKQPTEEFLSRLPISNMDRSIGDAWFRSVLARQSGTPSITTGVNLEADPRLRKFLLNQPIALAPGAVGLPYLMSLFGQGQEEGY